MITKIGLHEVGKKTSSGRQAIQTQKLKNKQQILLEHKQTKREKRENTRRETQRGRK